MNTDCDEGNVLKILKSCALVVKVSLWAVGNCDDVSYYFQIFYKQSVN